MNRVRELRTAKKLSQTVLAKELHISQGTLSLYERGIVEPDMAILKKLADVFDCSVDYIIGRTNIRKATALYTSTGLITPLYGVGTRSIPVLGNVACGEPKLAREEHETMVAVGAEISADFCLRAKGDSMTGDRIHDGDMVFVRSQPEVENGEIAVIVIGDEATLKHVFYYEDRKMLILRPSNPQYEDIIYNEGELETVTILGKAVAFQSLL